MGDRCVGFHMISYDLHTSSADGGSPVKSYSVVESRDPPPVDAELHERRSWPSGTGHCFTWLTQNLQLDISTTFMITSGSRFSAACRYHVEREACFLNLTFAERKQLTIIAGSSEQHRRQLALSQVQSRFKVA